MQPTTLCNLDCSYCYLPLRALDRRMPVEVAQAVAEAVNVWAADAPRFSVVWHGGEPLAAGRDHLAALMAPFAGVEHHIQTNATLIDDEWCEFFAERDIRIGLSASTAPGSSPATGAARRRPGVRPDPARHRHAAPARHPVRRAVRGRPIRDPAWPTELYEFFLDLGCDVLGINVEEQEGVNLRSNARSDEAVRAFWAELTAAWRGDPRIEVREIEWALRYAGAVLAGDADELLPRRLDPIPTIAHDGQVVLLSPELAGFASPEYGDFASGNVLATPLARDPGRAAAGPTGWIAEYLTGVEACRAGCPYFGFCGGAHAANRYFEHGRFDGTRDRALPQQQDLATGGSAGPCPSRVTPSPSGCGRCPVS